jgi:hypothetical protein
MAGHSCHSLLHSQRKTCIFLAKEIRSRHITISLIVEWSEEARFGVINQFSSILLSRVFVKIIIELGNWIDAV